MSDHRLHVMRGSAPCRATLLTLEILNEMSPLDVEIVDVDLSKGEHMGEPYLALNPLHTVPTLERVGTGGLRESRAIMRYLCELSVAPTLLYPEDPWLRAQVDALLDWDVGTFYKAIGGFVYPQVFRDELPDAEAVKALREVLRHLDATMDDGRTLLTGDHFTLADISVACGLSMLELTGDDPFSEITYVRSFYERMQALPQWDGVNQAFYGWKAQVRAL